MKKTLYKLANNGKTQEWTIIVVGSEFTTSEGYVGGAISTTLPTKCEGKRIGMSNETSPEQQATKEALAKIEKQKKKGWTEDINEIANATRKHLPMLAKKYEDEFEKLFSSTTVLAVQPKLDGIRSIGTKDGPFTKEGGVHNHAGWLLQDHVLELIGDLDWKCKLDGEFYNHEYKSDFNAIASIVRTKNPTPEELELAKEKLQYHVYDINADGTFAARYNVLKTLFELFPDPRFKLVETVFVNLLGRSRLDIDMQLQKLHTRFVKEGYEGSMIRDANSEYQCKRTRSLLKRKDWIDEEFMIVEIVKGKGNKAGMAASVTCVDERGEVFDAGIIGDNDYCTQLLVSKDEHVGKMATIKYQNLTPDRKVPRFGKMKAIRDYE